MRDVRNEEEEKPRTRWESNPQLLEFLLSGVSSTSVLQPLGSEELLAIASNLLLEKNIYMQQGSNQRPNCRQPFNHDSQARTVFAVPTCFMTPRITF